MLGVHLAPRIMKTNRIAAIAFAMAGEQAQYSHGPRRGTGCDQCLVKPSTEQLLAFAMLGADWLLQRGSVVGSLLKRCPPTLVAVANRLAQRLDFDLKSQVGDVLQVLERDRPKAEAALSFGFE